MMLVIEGARQIGKSYIIREADTIAVHAISNPRYPLKESLQKNLLKPTPPYSKGRDTKLWRSPCRRTCSNSIWMTWECWPVNYTIDLVRKIAKRWSDSPRKKLKFSLSVWLLNGNNVSRFWIAKVRKWRSQQKLSRNGLSPEGEQEAFVSGWLSETAGGGAAHPCQKQTVWAIDINEYIDY